MQGIHDDFWLNLANDAYSASSSYFDSNVRNRIISDIMAFQSEHPTGSKYYTDAYKLKSKLFRPKTRTSIRKNEAIAAAAFFSTEDVVAVRPMDDNDEMQQAGARIHKELLQYRLTKPKPHGMPWFLTCMGAYQDAQTVGLVVSFQEWVKNERKRLDRPDVKLIPVENFRFDPAADWRDVVESSPYLIVLWPMYVKDVKARMKRTVKRVAVAVNQYGEEVEVVEEVEDSEGRPWNRCDDGVILAASNAVTDTIRQSREGNRTDSKQNQAPISDYGIVWVHQNIVEIEGQDLMYYTLGTQHLLSQPVPVEEVYPQGRPFAVGFSIIEAHKTYPSSIPTITRDIQTEINDVANLRIDNVKLILNKRHIVRRGASVDLRSLTRNIPGSVTLANDPNGDVRFVTTDDATASSYQEQDRLNLDYDDLCGAFSGSSVASNRKLNETVGGMNILTQQANQVSEYQLRIFTETWVEPVLRQLIMLEQAYETDERVLAIVGRQSGIDAFGFNQVTDELIAQDTILNVAVGTGAVNPQVQLERFAFAMEMLAKIRPELMAKVKDEELITELFGKTGYKDGSRFFDLGDEEQQDPRMQQMMQEIEQLKQALAMKNPPEVVAATVRKLEAETEFINARKTNANVEALYGAMNTAQTAVQVPGITPVADAIAKSAGFEDKDQPPIYPAAPAQQQIPPGAQIPENTSPMFPANPGNPGAGMLNGMESGAGVVQSDNGQVA